LATKSKPELKILLYVTFIIALFVAQDLRVYLAAGVVLGLLFTRLPLKTLKSGWLPISIFLLFTFFSNVLGRQGRIVLSFGPVILTDEGVHIAVLRTLRVFFMIGGAKVLMSSMKTEEIVNALGRIFGPFEKFGVPVSDFFHTMGLTLKCFPVLKDMASAAYRENVKTSDLRGFRARARLLATFLLPLFLKSLQSPEAFFEGGDPAAAQLQKAE